MFDSSSMEYAFRWTATWAFLALFCYALLLYARTLWAYFRLSPVIPRYWPFVALLSAIAAMKACPIDLPGGYLKVAVYLEFIPLFAVLFVRGKCTPRGKSRKTGKD